MQYRDVMQPCSQRHFITMDATIKEAFIKLENTEHEILIAVDGEAGIQGKLGRDELFNAYRRNLSHNSSISGIIGKSYQVADETEVIKNDVFSAVPFVVVTNKSGTISGYLTEDILAEKLFQQYGEKIKKEITTKKILHQDENDFGIENTEDYIDFYRRIDKLIHINKELWDIIEYSSDSIYVTDGEGVTVYANDSFERMTGAPASSVLGKSVFEAEKEGIYKPSISAIVLREKRQVTLIQRGLNGKDLIVTGTPVFDVDGKIYMAICNSKDIDELSILKNYLLNVKAATIKTVDESQKKTKVIYTSESMVNLMKLVDKVTQVDSTVMITGESGTGKGLIARYIHDQSSRAAEKMIEINCSAIPETLFESELFGYESGAFTGARKGGKAGIIEMADKGTLFLDEIGDMPMHMQVKLLKVLQDKKVTRVGSLEPIDIDVRIIAATNKDLKLLIEKGLFRTDLYYRLNVFPLQINPLRERKEDIYLLLRYFLFYYNKKHKSNVVLTQKAQDKIADYSWPGNVRELEHFIERLVIINDGVVDAGELEMEQVFELEKAAVKINKILPLKEAVDETERQLIRLALKISQNSYEIADILEISQASAYRKMKKYT